MLSLVGTGFPTVYNEQEGSNDKWLEFFEKDLIVWHDDPMEGLCTMLFTLLEQNSALWHGDQGGKMIRVWTDKTDEDFSFSRNNGTDKVLAPLNFTGENQTVTLNDASCSRRIH